MSDRDELNKLKRACLERTPEGTRLAYLTGNELVLLGNPDPEEDLDSPDAHNCDAMGCGSMEHVVKRRRLSLEQMERLCRGEKVLLEDE